MILNSQNDFPECLLYLLVRPIVACFDIFVTFHYCKIKLQNKMKLKENEANFGIRAFSNVIFTINQKTFETFPSGHHKTYFMILPP